MEQTFASAAIRVLGGLWTALFALIGIGCLVMRYFIPVGWPSAVPILVRFLVFLAYLVANLGFGIYAMLAPWRDRTKAATRLGSTILVFSAILLTVSAHVGTEPRGAYVQTHVIPVTFDVGVACAILGFAAIALGVGIRRGHTRTRAI
jgi:hypothetical protein